MKEENIYAKEKLSLKSYFLFLKSLTPLTSVTYSNPDSIGALASSTFSATLQTCSFEPKFTR